MNKEFLQNELNGAQYYGDVVAVLDVGSSKISCLIAQLTVSKNGTPPKALIIGSAQQKSKGIRAGMITDMQAAESCLRAAIASAEQMADVKVDDVIIGVSICPLEHQTCSRFVLLPHGLVREEDIARVLRLAPYDTKKDNDTLLHAIPIRYDIDGLEKVHHPLGMHGDRLNVYMHLISTPNLPMKNLLACFDRCHLAIDKLIVAPYASALAILVEDEKNLGTLCIDMGGETTSLSIFYDGSPIYTTAIPMGAHHITRDIAQGLSAPIESAERIKVLRGSVFSKIDSQTIESCLDIPILGAKKTEVQTVELSSLVKIIRPRVDEILELVRQKLEKDNMLFAAQNAVLTGGGALLSGVREMAQQVLEKQHVRIGHPKKLAGLPESFTGPAYAACVGLIVHRCQNFHEKQDVLADNKQGRLSQWAQWLRSNF